MKEKKFVGVIHLVLFIIVGHEALLISRNKDNNNNSFANNVQQQRPPDIKCRVGRKDNLKIRLVNETQGDGQFVLTKSHDRLEFQCDANYVTRWIVSKNVERMLDAVPVVSRSVKNIFNTNTFKFHSEVYLSVKQGFSGFVGCENAQNSSLRSKIHIFIPEGKYFAGDENKIDIFSNNSDFENPQDEYTLIPCPSNYPDNIPAAKLFQVFQDDEGLEYTKPVKALYEPKIGFYMRQPIITNGNDNETEELQGTFRCVAGSEEVTIEFKSRSQNETIEGDVTGLKKGTETVEEYGSPNLIWPPNAGKVICENKDHKPARQLIQSINCMSPYDCDLFRPCFSNPDDCPERMSRGTGCHFGACALLQESQYSGLIKCTAGRNQSIEYFFTGLDRRRYTLSSSIPKRALIQLDMDSVKPILYTNEPMFFFCQASSYLFTQELQFAVVYKNETKAPLPIDSYRVAEWEEVEDRQSRGAVQQGIFVNLTEEMKAIVCLAPWYNSTEWLDISTEFIARDVIAPVIDKSSGDRIFYRGEKNRNLFCSSLGEPKPRIKWMFNGTEIFGNETTTDGDNFGIVTTDEGGSILNFPQIHDKFEGVYTCAVENQFGNDTFDFRVQVHERKLLSRGVIYGVSIVGAIGFLALCLALAFMWRKYIITRNKLRNLTAEEIEEFVKGNPEALHQNNPQYGCLPAQYLPFDPKWEIPESDIEIDKNAILGSGEFGLVVQGQLKGENVAIKTTKANADVTYFKALLGELKVMAYIGKHQNIVHFLGACTSKIKERIVYVVVELSPIGSLESYLKANREIYDNFMGLNQNNLVKANKVAYISFEKKITSTEFAKWSYQIASGMEYLANKKVIHGDLATRNVLLFQGETAKITDFGLSRQLYEHTNYIKKNEVPLPWRWMAIESLRNLEFSTKSDVWSYGITVAEIFTMAEIPYAGLSWSLEFLEKLEKGMRVRKPKLATDAVYDTLLKCWHPVPQYRISFEELKEFFYKMLTSDLSPQGSYVRIDHTAALSDYCL